MKRKELIDKISAYLSRFVQEVKSYNAGGLYDINIHSENALIPILNVVFGVELRNANAHGSKNHPSVDLVDDSNRIAFQITATSSIDKIKDTLDRFDVNNFHLKYDTLYVYILTEKQASYSESAIKDHAPKELSFSPKEHIIDYSDIMSRIMYMESLEKLELLARLCQHEFSDTQIEQRKRKFQSGYLKNEAEKLYLNILPISFPEKIFIADIDIDTDAIKERINQKRVENGWRKQRKFKPGELFANELRLQKIYVDDYVLRENRIITFRNLYDNREPLARLIDKGTATYVDAQDYYEQDNDYLNNFKYLLKRTLIEFGKYRELQWINKKGILRFKNHREVPNIKQVKWKGKKEATKTVIFEMMSKKDKEGNSHVICYRNMAFKPSFMQLGEQWYLVVNPTWSFTNPGGNRPSRFEESYLKGLKRQETNEAVYYQYRFLGYYLSYYDMFTEQNKYPYLSIQQQLPMNFIPKMEDEKWLPPKEFAPLNEREAELTTDKELNKMLFE